MSLVRHLVLFVLTLFLFSCDSETDCGCDEPAKENENLVFIGDSLIAGWKLSRYFPCYFTQNKGVSGACLQDIPGWEIDAKGKTAVFLIGTNNLGGVSSIPETFYADFVEQYLEIIASLQCKRTIVISLLPRVPDAHRSGINQEILRLNKELENAFASREEILFLDVYANFAHAETHVNPIYFNDGLHLNNKGYELLTSLVSAAL